MHRELTIASFGMRACAFVLLRQGVLCYSFSFFLQIIIPKVAVTNKGRIINDGNSGITFIDG